MSRVLIVCVMSCSFKFHKLKIVLVDVFEILVVLFVVVKGGLNAVGKR